MKRKLFGAMAGAFSHQTTEPQRKCILSLLYYTESLRLFTPPLRSKAGALAHTQKGFGLTEAA